ncbi:cell division protein SepF [Nocardioides sp. CER19]|uniref:cell division protein SepF n=1 Tax=Nocardioides sp. CER19 TaxID=3038538 RepID=UPI00244A69F0|nr:cell division protein SepF [Nocardioides sp. CER19]MDH2416695.1 cell division protein SepF [Nocardioides sp. CER19]
MSGAMRRIGEYLGLLEDTGRYDDYTGEYDAYDDSDYTRESPVVTSRAPKVREARPEPRQAAPATVADLSERRRPQAVPDVAELSRIVTLQPTTYNDARAVGEHYRDGTPVIMNLSEMEDADAKRLVDFAAGLIFATHGDIERVTNKVFLLSPHNVSVAAEAKRRIAEGGFFNQS